MKFDASAVQEKIGYVFRDQALLKRCFTHSSYSNAFGGENNERLEFLGDAVLGYIVADELYRLGGSEGEMTRLRIRLVSQKPLEKAVRAMGLEEYLLFSGENNVGGKGVSSLFEALLAGICLDGGMEEARRFVRAHLPFAQDKEPNFKGELQEYLQKMHLALAAYEVVAQEGEDHAPRFTVRATAAGTAAFGTGKNVRDAEKAAAKELLARLKKGE